MKIIYSKIALLFLLILPAANLSAYSSERSLYFNEFRITGMRPGSSLHYQVTIFGDGRLVAALENTGGFKGSVEQDMLREIWSAFTDMVREFPERNTKPGIVASDPIRISAKRGGRSIEITFFETSDVSGLPDRMRRILEKLNSLLPAGQRMNETR